ncbi:Phospholipase B [Spironucleus salmonicida]|uniref:Phospholipase B-like n=1 Tax=Spironucleus salmonicida TaxID=348837 RepID=V6LT75_9EUKA|nr:Phospholipase B [Spironucleus salmonicida]|eukprot:EST47780.1 Phospholipase B [Spironucleus salmonicida]
MLVVLAKAMQYSFSGARDNVIISNIYNQDSIASVVLNDLNETSARWELLVQTRKQFTSKDQAYFGGYAEGYATADLIQAHLFNIKNDQYDDKNANWNQIYIDYANTNIKYLQEKSVMNPDNLWWQGVSLIINDWLEGITKGVQQKYPQITMVDIFMMNAQGDLEDIEGLYPETYDQFKWKIEKGQQHHCSAAIVLSPELDDAWFSHDTWTSFYSGFVRIAKTYNFNWKLQYTQQQNITFSSMPGVFFSIDDFYVIKNTNETASNNIAVLETTYHTFNEELFSSMDKFGNQSALTWLRCQLSNLQSMTPQQWNQSFNTEPSYTYNNNYLFLDYLAIQEMKDSATNQRDRFNYVKSHDLSLLYTLEVVPTSPMFWDATDTLLEQKFYISINVPTNEDLLELAGYNAKNEDYWSYNRSSRYCIAFKQLHKVYNYEEFKSFMRYNDYKHDSCSNQDPGQSISSRYDLRDFEVTHRESSLMGATDSKTVNLLQAHALVFDFVVGAIQGGKSEIPPFDFSTQAKKQPEGYYNIFPNIWAETLSYGCLENDMACNHGSCQSGSCICEDFFAGIYCDICPDNFDKTCTKCSNGFKLIGRQCVWSGNDLYIGMAIGIPSATLILGFIVWFGVVCSQKKTQKSDEEKALLMDDDAEVSDKKADVE